MKHKINQMYNPPMIMENKHIEKNIEGDIEIIQYEDKKILVFYKSEHPIDTFIFKTEKKAQDAFRHFQSLLTPEGEIKC